MSTLNRAYWVRDLANVVDSVDTFDGNHYYTYTGAPSWFNNEEFYPGSTEQYPTFSFQTPEGLVGSELFTVEKYTNAGVLVDTGVIGIFVQAVLDPPAWTIQNGCYTANIVFKNPAGGWSSYIFAGKQQSFQDAGRSSTFINSVGEKRYDRKDEVHQGVIISADKLPPDHVLFVGDMMKSIQAYLWVSLSEFVPILISPQTFRRVKTGDPYANYEFEFRFAEEDVIQTQ